MVRGKAWWARWRRVAHRAAIVQSNVILTVLYFVMIVPVGYLKRLGRARANGPPAWLAVPRADEDASRWRAQF